MNMMSMCVSLVWRLISDDRGFNKFTLKLHVYLKEI